MQSSLNCKPELAWGGVTKVIGGLAAFAQPTLKTFAAMLFATATIVTVADLPSSTASPEAVSTSHLALALGGGSRSGSASNLAPGDSFRSAFDVALSPLNANRVVVTVTATRSSL